MRIAELKKQINDIAPEAIVLTTSQSNYNSVTIGNANVVMPAVKNLLALGIVDGNYESVNQILDRYTVGDSFSMSTQEYQQLENYIKQFNQIIVMYRQVLANIDPNEKSENTFSVKLSSDLESMDDFAKLASQLKELDKYLKTIYGKGVSFGGFDKGSAFVDIVVVGIACPLFIEVIKYVPKIVKKIKDKGELKRQSAIIQNYQISVNGDGNKVEINSGKVVGAIKKQGEDEIVESVNNHKEKFAMTSAGRGKDETASEVALRKIINVTIDIVGNGNEVHLPLNPPEYVKEEAGEVLIDYDQIPKFDKGEVKEIDSGEVTDGGGVASQKKK